MKSKIIILVIIVITLVTGYLIFEKKPTPATQELRTVTTPSVITPQPQYEVGEITDGGNGTLLFTSNKYGFSFSFPSDWEVSDNRIDYGTFQLFSPTSTADQAVLAAMEKNPGGDFSAVLKGTNINQITMVILDSSMFYPSRAEKIEVDIGGVKGYRQTEYSRASNWTRISHQSYTVELPSYPGKFLHMIISGDEDNLFVLSDIIKSFRWLK